MAHRELTRSEMIELVTRICSGEGTQAELDENVELFLANCRHPGGTDLIFWPHGFPRDRSKPEPTVEEIVDKALNYDRVVLALPPPREAS